jgi:hypothetical protein
MSGFIARAIEKEEQKGSGMGAALYRKYFVVINTWDKYQPDVDIILTADGYGECIVTE